MTSQQLMTVANHHLPGNSIKLPHTYLEQIVENRHSPPYYFNITSEIGTSITVSVNEFTSDLGTVEVTKEALDNLLIDSNYIVTVKLETKDIPKGKSIRLIPQQREFFTVPEYDSVLEQRLSKYSIISNGQNIQLEIFDKQYSFVVDNIEPDWETMSVMEDSEIINIIDVDLSVDVHNKFLKEDEEEVKRNMEKIKKQMEEEKKRLEALEKEKKKLEDELEEKNQEQQMKAIKEKFLARFG